MAAIRRRALAAGLAMVWGVPAAWAEPAGAGEPRNFTAEELATAGGREAFAQMMTEGRRYVLRVRTVSPSGPARLVASDTIYARFAIVDASGAIVAWVGPESQMGSYQQAVQAARDANVPLEGDRPRTSVLGAFNEAQDWLGGQVGSSVQGMTGNRVVGSAASALASMALDPTSSIVLFGGSPGAVVRVAPARVPSGTGAGAIRIERKPQPQP